MKKSLVLMVGSVLILSACNFDDGDHDFYFSESQYSMGQMIIPRRPDNYIKINGKWFLYTETVDREKVPSGKWDDYEFIGHGFISQVRIRSIK